MPILRRLPALLALLLLGAHFLRADRPLLTLLALALLGPLAVPRPWARQLTAGALALGALEWLRTLAVDALDRAAGGAPWTRLAVILGAVALFTAWAAWLLRIRTGPGR